jgi:hypothetical protein
MHVTIASNVFINILDSVLPIVVSICERTLNITHIIKVHVENQAHGLREGL